MPRQIPSGPSRDRRHRNARAERWRSGTWVGIVGTLLPVFVGCNQLLGNGAPDGAASGGQANATGGGTNSGGTDPGASGGAGSGGLLGSGGAPASGGATGTGGSDPVVCVPACTGDQVCVGEGTCQPVLPECVGLAVGTAVCTGDDTEAFTCGEALAVKDNQQYCPHFCRQGACVEPPSCVESGSDCGTDMLDGGCCRSPRVTGGLFNRGSTSEFPATIADFRLDKYEVTVQRFRKFVEATVDGWMPAAGSGKHTHLRSGAGLLGTAGEGEPGWDAAWNVPANGLFSTAGDWDDALQCGSDNYFTWTPGADLNEFLPINCLNWYQAAAFCIWDGGFLPSEAEWEYAAAGGALERIYPWGTPEPSADLAVYACLANAPATCSFLDIPTVGSRPEGDTAFGQSDLGGSMWEWTLDFYSNPFVPTECDNCTNTTASVERVNRGGSWLDAGDGLANIWRNSPEPLVNSEFYGVRCARAP